MSRWHADNDECAVWTNDRSLKTRSIRGRCSIAVNGRYRAVWRVLDPRCRRRFVGHNEVCTACSSRLHNGAFADVFRVGEAIAIDVERADDSSAGRHQHLGVAFEGDKGVRHHRGQIPLDRRIRLEGDRRLAAANRRYSDREQRGHAE